MCSINVLLRHTTIYPPFKVLCRLKERTGPYQWAPDTLPRLHDPCCRIADTVQYNLVGQFQFGLVGVFLVIHFQLPPLYLGLSGVGYCR